MADHDKYEGNHVIVATMAAGLVLAAIVLLDLIPLVPNYAPLWAGLNGTVHGLLDTALAGILIFLIVAVYRNRLRGRKGKAADPSIPTVEQPTIPAPPSEGETLRHSMALALPPPAESSVGVRTFLAAIDLDTVAAIDMVAITGELQVRPICELLERAKSLNNRKLPVRILLRADSSSDTRRIQKREATREAFERVRQAIPDLDYEIRFYSAPSPLRSTMLRHTNGSYSAYLSFYDWRTEDLMSVRESEVPWCYLRDRVAADDKLLSVYRSWFAQFWGRHRIHTLLFDFDDTLFQTTDIQVRAWMYALRTGVESGLIEKTMIAQDVRDVLPDQGLLQSVLIDISLWEQQESNMIRRLFPAGLNDERLDALRAIRLRARDAATVRDAVPFHALTQYLERLHKDYQLVVVSATAEQSIRDVLKKHELPFFSHVFGKEALHGWRDIEGKTPTFVRASNMLGVPLERMAFVGDSEADFRAARQLGLKFIESRLNARNFGKESLIRSRTPQDDLFIVDTDARNTLLAAIEQVESALATS